MTTYTIDRTTYPCNAAVADRIRTLVADGYNVEVCDGPVVAYRVEAVPASILGGPAYWLRSARGFTVGTIADADALVRYANAMESRRAA